MLTCAGFGNDTLLPHVFREERLPNRIVYLVSASVVQVLAL